MNLVARWPGCTHDSTIFNSSAIRAEFETRAYPEGFLLGDRYPCRNYLHTPLLDPNTPAEQCYTSVHIKTRNIIERAFGVMKRRFPCLTKYLQVNIDRVSSIICATVALHNMACNAGIPDAPDDPEANVYDGVPMHVVVPVPAADVQDRQTDGCGGHKNCIDQYSFCQVVNLAFLVRVMNTVRLLYHSNNSIF
ncbi:hypothetical protein PR048_005072 [Dryococelus australis]|uniref:DDE Tnp4 domain-containing protein n=1 Tax=Dryococelus australis TaxID=614101 RepID=A0ABQ9I7N2_9NEOP|nr:hypothetical protein PR048_005072 [Dryococelus australis]